MKGDNITELLKKYKEGNSSLSEEQFLFDNAVESVPSMEVWSTFIKKNRIETPKDFNDRLWESFENKKSGKHRRFIGIMAIAASIIIIFSLYLAVPEQNEIDYAKKEAILNQALNMVYSPRSEETERKIIYENEMLIIYTTKE